MKHPLFAPFAVAFVLALACSPHDSELLDRPNIVLIIGDDHGYVDAGFMGSELVKTPHLDRLASEGTVFTTAYNTASVCRPSLASLLTGLQPLQLDAWEERLKRKRHAIAPTKNYILSVHTLPSLLALRGYRSFQAGKHWHGDALQAGFSDGTKKGPLEGPPLARQGGGSEGLEVGRSTMQPIWDFLETSAASGQPFLLWFAPQLPHRPMDAPEAILARYDGAPLSRSARAYYANISRLDDRVGELMERLDALELRERTLVVYLSDNGWDNAPDANYSAGRGDALGGVRGKLSMYELGFRTPIIFRWPGSVPSGRLRDDLVSTLDLFPTLLGYAGLTGISGREGVDLRAAIQDGAPLPKRSLYGHMDGALQGSVGPETRLFQPHREAASFARNERWHYIRFESGAEELYDVRKDPFEEHNVLREHTRTPRELRREIDGWKQRLQRALPDSSLRVGQWPDLPPVNNSR